AGDRDGGRPRHRPTPGRGQGQGGRDQELRRRSPGRRDLLLDRDLRRRGGRAPAVPAQRWTMEFLGIRLRLLMIVGLTLLCGFLVYPPSRKINRGLDLKGGIHMVMRVKTDDAVKVMIDLDQERIRSALGDKGLAPTNMAVEGLDILQLSGIEPARIDEARELVRTQFPQYDVSSTGPGRLRLALRAQDESSIRDSAVRQAVETIRTRVDKFGVAEPTNQRQGPSPEAACLLIQPPGAATPRTAN